MLKVNDFFCGCGGMGLAFKEAGFDIAGAWDFDKFAVQSYQANVSDKVQLADIKELHWDDIPHADVWSFGFPCQDLSVAGKKAGFVLECESCGNTLCVDPKTYDGEATCGKCGGKNFKAASRSGCFFEMMRLLKETEENNKENLPSVIIAENVKGVRPYLPVLELEYKRRGYAPYIQMFNSKYWGVPQNRERYAIVGVREDLGLSFEFPQEQHETTPNILDFLEEDVEDKFYLPQEKMSLLLPQVRELGFSTESKVAVTINKCGRNVVKQTNTSPCLTARDYKGYCGNKEMIGLVKNNTVRKLTPKEHGVLQGFPMDSWNQVVSNTQSYKQFGNAVTVSVFAAIAANIKNSLTQE